MKRIDRIGETRINKQGLETKIIGYRNRRDMDVLFSDGYIMHGVHYNCFVSGSINSPMYPDVLGVGYLGIGEHRSRINGIKTQAYIIWSSMLTRCYSDKFIGKQNYEKCFVCDDWLNFQNFARWHEANYYFLEDESVELDKDIIMKGNKIYSPETCLYVPHKINTVICNRHNDRGKHLIGVQKRRGKYIAICNIEGERKYIGIFSSENDAYVAYKNAKEAEIQRVAESYRGRIPNIVIEYISKYTIDMTD